MTKNKPKTSHSHPLRIDGVRVPMADGQIGVTICPGKKQSNAMSGSWDRNLETDLRALRDWGATILVSLLEEHEFSHLGVADLPEIAARQGLQWLHMPIADFSTPSRFSESCWYTIARQLKKAITDGQSVVIHCKGGLGRSGMMAACLLREFGMEAENAIQAVRAARKGAIETKEQEDYIRKYSVVTDRITVDHFLGCMLGGAAGDALGAPVEFMSIDAIRQKFGSQGVTGFEEAYGRKGAITDDTQMTLFTAEGLLRAYSRFCEKGIGPVFSSVTHNAYLRWLHTQSVGIMPASMRPEKDGWLICVQELFARRAPGNSCLGALRTKQLGTPGDPINNSKGCGGVMRMAPVGLFLASPQIRDQFDEQRRTEIVFDIGAALAALTHGHPTGYLAAGFLAVVIAKIVSGSGLRDAIAAATGILKTKENHGECLAAVDLACALADGNALPSPDVIERIGAGWIAEEALAISIYCALVSENDFRKAVLLAVNHSGDSDSTGAITGNILGALHGSSTIPQEWLDELELRSVIEEIAHDLFTGHEDDDRWRDRYPGW